MIPLVIVIRMTMTRYTDEVNSYYSQYRDVLIMKIILALKFYPIKVAMEKARLAGINVHDFNRIKKKMFPERWPHCRFVSNNISRGLLLNKEHEIKCLIQELKEFDANQTMNLTESDDIFTKMIVPTSLII